MVLRGALAAGAENVLTYRDAALPPVLLGPIAPPPSVAVNAELPPCALSPPPPPPPGATTTTTRPAAECAAAALADYDALLCRLSGIKLAVQASSPRMLGGRSTARRLSRRIMRTLRAVEVARSGRRVAHKLGAAGRQLARLLRSVQRGLDRGVIDATLGARLLDLGGGAAAEIDALRTAS
jgi:hypothetical protein